VVRFDRDLGLVVPCADLSRVRQTSCPHDEGWAEPRPDGDGLPVVWVYLPTDGTAADADRVRTTAANVVPNAIIHVAGDESDPDALFLADLRTLLQLACLFVLLVAACSLAAGTVGGLIERRRPFALLHASGVRLGELRRIVFLETAATMLVTSTAGAVLGLLVAYVTSRTGEMAFRWPQLDSYLMLGSGVLTALLLSMAALPLLRSVTRHNALRYE